VALARTSMTISKSKVAVSSVKIPSLPLRFYYSENGWTAIWRSKHLAYYRRKPLSLGYPVFKLRVGRLIMEWYPR
jgi:hypothetical protein